MSARLTLYAETIPTPIGAINIITDGQGVVRALDFDDYADRTVKLLDRHYGPGQWQWLSATKKSEAASALTAWFAGHMGAFDRLKTVTRGTDFQHKVWAELRRTKPGQMLSYGELAGRIGHPAAVRAVGLANGANPIAIMVPCHRIIGANGKLTGFAGGLERKQWLLAHEARHAGLSLAA